MIKRARRLFVEALELAERNGVCHCGEDLRTHSGWDNHAPVWWLHEEDYFLSEILRRRP